MKKTGIIIIMLLILSMTTPMVLAAKPDCGTIPKGDILYSTTHYLGDTPIPTGYDMFGYNYQGHMFKGYYANVYLGGDGYPPYMGDDELYEQRLIDEGYIIQGMEYDDVTLPDWGSGNTAEIWDLTKSDLILKYTIDMSAMVSPGWVPVEVGLRQEGSPNIDPNYVGGWLQSMFKSTENNPDADLNDYHVLMKHGWSEEYYDYSSTGPMVSTAPGTYINYAFWFDRGAVDEWQETFWNYKDGITYNTGGVYEVEIKYHAIDSLTGTMFVTINGEEQGFYSSGYDSGNPPDLMPVGRTFEGDMTQMQVFYGRGGGGGNVELTDVSVEYYYADDPYDTWYWPYRGDWLLMKWNDAWLSNKDCDGDGKLDRHYGYASYVGSGAWETNHQWGSYEAYIEELESEETIYWNYFCKIVAVPADAILDTGIWYTADGVEIGYTIWGEFAVIQEVWNDAYEDVNGLYYNPAGPTGFGYYMP